MPTQASIPIRHGGILAKRASTWPRNHFYNRAMLIVAHDMERVLADIDTNHGDCSVLCLGYGMLLCDAPSQHPIAGGAGARPDHPLRTRSRILALGCQ